MPRRRPHPRGARRTAPTLKARALLPSVALVVGMLLALVTSGVGRPAGPRPGQEIASESSTASSTTSSTTSSPRLAFVTRGDDLVDAPAVTGVAGQLDAVVVLSATARLSPEAREALDQFDPDLVVLVGGPSALAPQVERDVEALGLATERVAGTSRFATAQQLVAFLETQRGAAVAERADEAASEPVAAPEAVVPSPAAAADAADPARVVEGEVRLLPAASAAVSSVGGIGAETQTLATLTFEVPDTCGDGSTQHDLRIEATYFVQNDAASDAPGAAGDTGLYRAAVDLDGGAIRPGSGGVQVTDVEVREGAAYADAGYESVAHDLVVAGVGPGQHRALLLAEALDADFLMRTGEITLVVTDLAGRCG